MRGRRVDVWFQFQTRSVAAVVARRSARRARARSCAMVRVREMTSSDRRAYVAALVRDRDARAMAKDARWGDDVTDDDDDDEANRRARGVGVARAGHGGDGGGAEGGARRGRRAASTSGARTAVKARYMEYETRRRRRDAEEAEAERLNAEARRRRRGWRGGAGEAAPDMSDARRARLAGRHSRDAVVAEVEARRAREETFTPRARAPIATRDDAGRVGATASAAQRLATLAMPKTALWERAASVKAASDAAAFEEHCTFTPKTGRGPKTGSSDAPAGERLYAYAEKRAEKLERAQARVVELELEELTFQPSTMGASMKKKKKKENGAAPPLHERLDDVLRRKRDALLKAKAKVEHERSSAYTFKPEINPTSAALAKQRAELDEAMGEDGERRAGRRRDVVDEDVDELTFAPKITTVSERVVEQLARQGKMGADFFERQREYNDKVARRAEEHRAYEDDECTFTPDIGDATRVLRKGQRVRMLLETPEERAARLAFTDAERKRMTQRVLEQKYYEKYTYNPDVNERSRTLAPVGTSLDDLVHDERRELAKRRARAQLEREFREEHTFEPNLDQSKEARRARNTSAYAMDYGLGGDVVSARIEAYQREKNDALENLRKYSANREMEECTFKPITNARAPPKSMYVPSTAKVKGLNAFLQKQNKARLLEAEKRERFSKVFLEDLDDYDRKGKRTIPEPFGVAENVDEKAEMRQKMLAEERLAREMEECTFTPKTNVEAATTSRARAS